MSISAPPSIAQIVPVPQVHGHSRTAVSRQARPSSMLLSLLTRQTRTFAILGGSQLWRSPAATSGSLGHAESWSAITSTLTGIITAIAIHPTDSNTVYVGTSQGHIYRVQKTGATWNLADVTTTDLTGANLPTSLYISDLVVDTAGTVWVTVAAVLWTESTGEFSNNHVYRRLAGASTWETRSNGLAQANPINSIVIDPTNQNRLFCGGDAGVFRTEDAGGNWTAWDEGLPKCASV